MVTGTRYEVTPQFTAEGVRHRKGARLLVVVCDGQERSNSHSTKPRLWETYLVHYADIAPNHVDRDADMIEHVLGSEMVSKLESLLGSKGIPESPHPVEGTT